VRPAGGFGAPGCVRVTIGTREANEAFVAGLSAILQ
jgi:histidinol-phosphate/aromatic aminotransferase/cobyric acid decarboxylase-like protein